MSTETLCPICQQDASVRPLERWDGFRIECETCGRFNISGLIAHVRLKDYQDEKGNNLSIHSHIYSGLTRQASDSGTIISITTENISTLLESVAIPTSPLENMDRALIYVSEQQSKADEEIQVFYQRDYPKAFAKDGDEFRYFLDALYARGLLGRRGDSPGRSNQFYRLTPEGWEKIQQIKSIQIDSNQAFVAMWFADSLLGAWEQGFEPALKSTLFNPLRVDLAEFNGRIDDYIIAQIRRSGLLVADFTGHRGGVYFEAGFAMGLGIPVILTCRDSDVGELHFDTRQYNHIFWENPQELQEKLQHRIAATIPGRAIIGSGAG